MPRELTRRQKQVLTFIRWWIGRKGYPPSLRQIGAGVRIGTPNGVRCHLLAIERKGYIHRDRRVCRGLRLLEPAAVPMLRVVSGEDDESPCQ